jgi:hypothetical protein
MLGTNSSVFSAGHLWTYPKLVDDVYYKENMAWRDEATRRLWSDVTREVKSFGLPAESASRKQRLRSLCHVHDVLCDLTGADVICDYSHGPDWHHLFDDPAFDVFHIHLVRDGRAVAKSIERKYNPSIRNMYLWSRANFRIAVGMQSKNHFLVRYEDLVSNPSLVLSRILDRASKHLGAERLRRVPEGDRLMRLDDPIYDSRMIKGNRMARRRDGARIEPDNAYVSSYSPAKWWSYTMLGLPGLTRFGYPFSQRAVA